MAVKRIRKLFDDYDDILSAVYRPSKISCFEKDCYSNGGGYVNVESDDEDEDAASFLDYDDEAATDSDDEAAAYLVQEFLSFVDEFISCDKVHSVKEGCMDEKTVKRGGNVTCDEANNLDEESSGDNVNGELSENEGYYWDEWSCRYTKDKAIILL
ncbi:hypothetical protein Tco_1396244 [Tanacetum coccineum]